MKRGKRRSKVTSDCTASELDNVANSNDVSRTLNVQSWNMSPFSIFDGKLLRVPITEGFVMLKQNCPANDSAGRLKILFVNGLR